MTITAYRIARQEYGGTMWTGSGARDYGGRWNSKGIAVVYTSKNRSLAAMEQLVHLIKPRVLRGFVVASIRFDDTRLRRIQPGDLPRGWDQAVAPAALKKYGDAWISAGQYPVLAVPSVIVRGEWNYLLNPAHPEFRRFSKSKPEAFVYDDRLG